MFDSQTNSPAPNPFTDTLSDGLHIAGYNKPNYTEGVPTFVGDPGNINPPRSMTCRCDELEKQLTELRKDIQALQAAFNSKN